MDQIRRLLSGQWAVLGDWAAVAGAVVAVMVAAWILARLSRRLILRSAQRNDGLDPTVLPVLTSAVRYLIYVVALVICLDIAGINTAGMITAIGAAGIAVGLALKDTLANIVSGIMLLVLRPMSVGDYVEFSSTEGTVREIRLFTTVFDTFDGLYIVVPNSIIWDGHITNFTRNGKRCMVFTVGIGYEDEIGRGLEIIDGVIASDSRVLTDPGPTSFVSSLDDSAVTLEARAWATTDDYWATKRALTRQIKEEIEKGGLSIPFPQRVVHVEGAAKGH